MTKTRFYLIQTSDCQKVVCNRTIRISIRILQIIPQSSAFFLTGILKEFWWKYYGLLIKWFMLVTSFFLPYPKLFVKMKQRHQKFWSTKFAPRLNKQHCWYTYCLNYLCTIMYYPCLQLHEHYNAIVNVILQNILHIIKSKTKWKQRSACFCLLDMYHLRIFLQLPHQMGAWLGGK